MNKELGLKMRRKFIKHIMILHDKKYKYEFLIDTFQHCKLSHITPNVYVTFNKYLNYIAKHF